jgi:acyl-CoA thioester hydrolase
MHKDNPNISETLLRVTYADTDQMGVAYYGSYPVWLEIARTEYLRARGQAYRDLEATGLRLVVSELRLRYRAPARYDDLVRVRCWVRDIASRRVTFGYAIDRGEGGELLATGVTDLLSLDRDFRPIRLPPLLSERLTPTPDPVRV